MDILIGFASFWIGLFFEDEVLEFFRVLFKRQLVPFCETNFFDTLTEPFFNIPKSMRETYQNFNFVVQIMQLIQNPGNQPFKILKIKNCISSHNHINLFPLSKTLKYCIQIILFAPKERLRADFIPIFKIGLNIFINKFTNIWHICHNVINIFIRVFFQENTRKTTTRSEF